MTNDNMNINDDMNVCDLCGTGYYGRKCPRCNQCGDCE